MRNTKKKYELFIGNKFKSQLQTLANYKAIENVIKSKNHTYAIFDIEYTQRNSSSISILAGFRIEVYECKFEDVKEIVESIKKSCRLKIHGIDSRKKQLMSYKTV